MSLVGKKIEEFKADAFQEEKGFFLVNDKELLGKWSILFFYPGDFTFVCPTELKDLQDHYDKFKKLGVEVYSISTDSHFTHKAWHDYSESVKSIKYIMVSDIKHEISKLFNVLNKETCQSQRATFIIDPDGIIQAMEINANGIGRNASVLLDKVKAAQYIRKNPSEVCPANWKQGDETLKPTLDLVGKI